MTKKTYRMIQAIIGGVSAIATAIIDAAVANPPSAVIIAAVGIAVTAANEILLLFVKEEETKK